MTKTAPLTPDELIAAADEEIAEAEALEQTLEQRVLEGDETVDAEQIETARGVKRFAQLRRQAAQRKADALAAKLKAAEFDAFLKEHAPHLTGRDEQLEPIFAKIRPLLDEAIELSAAIDRHVFALARAAESPGDEWRPEENPRLVGDARLPQYAWAAVDGVRAEVLGAGGVIRRLLIPYRERGVGRYSALGDFLR